MKSFCNMDALTSLVGEDYKRADYEEILETARLLSQNDPEVVKKIEFALDDPRGYFEDLPNRDNAGGWLFPEKITSLYDALFFLMIFELSEHGYFITVKWERRFEAFLNRLKELKNYDMIAGAVQTLNEYYICGMSVSEWSGLINEAAGGKAYVCRIDILPHKDPDPDYPLVIVSGETLKKARGISEYNQKHIEAYPNKELYDPLEEFFDGYKPKNNGKNLIEAAMLLSGGDKDVIKGVRAAVKNIKSYYYHNADDYEYFSVYMNELKCGCYEQDIDPGKLLIFGMLNELLQHCYIKYFYCNQIYYFFKSLEELRNYKLIADVIPSIKFNHEADVKAWCLAINAALSGETRLVYFNLDFTKLRNIFFTVIPDDDMFEKINKLITNLLMDI